MPASLIESMKRKELRRLIAHFLKLNSQMTGTSAKMLTQLQAKIHYLDIVSGLPSYGAKCFSTNQHDGVERVLLVSPRFGLSQIAGLRSSVVSHSLCFIITHLLIPSPLLVPASANLYNRGAYQGFSDKNR